MVAAIYTCVVLYYRVNFSERVIYANAGDGHTKRWEKCRACIEIGSEKREGGDFFWGF